MVQLKFVYFAGSQILLDFGEFRRTSPSVQVRKNIDHISIEVINQIRLGKYIEGQGTIHK